MIETKVGSILDKRVSEKYTIGEEDLIDNQYILLQIGKKKYFIIKLVA